MKIHRSPKDASIMERNEHPVIIPESPRVEEKPNKSGNEEARPADKVQNPKKAGAKKEEA